MSMQCALNGQDQDTVMLNHNSCIFIVENHVDRVDLNQVSYGNLICTGITRTNNFTTVSVTCAHFTQDLY